MCVVMLNMDESSNVISAINYLRKQFTEDELIDEDDAFVHSEVTEDLEFTTIRLGLHPHSPLSSILSLMK